MKAKITVTITRVIDLDLYNEFEPEKTNEERLDAELQYAENLFHEWINAEDVEWETKGEFHIDSTESPNEVTAE